MRMLVLTLVAALLALSAFAPSPAASKPHNARSLTGGAGHHSRNGNGNGIGGSSGGGASGSGGATGSGSGSSSRRDNDVDPLVVETLSGPVQGFAKTVLSREVHVFYGIPFAKPPVGPLRFRRPVPVDPWQGVLNATTLPNACFQERYEYFPGFEGEEMWNPNTNISEDCLYLNIWVPQRVRMRHHFSAEKRPVPVLVWIYGGGYMSGTSTLEVYNADMVAATSDVIVASMQYRVGAFGFLFLPPSERPDLEDAAGNMGLWDQALAIRWIKNNIAKFGGDPNLITLFGESAGAGAVSLHLLSPITRGMAKRGIMQSGTLNAPWSYMTGEKAGDVARRLIDDVGCNSTKLPDASLKVMSCMRSVDAKTISTRQWNSYWGILGFPSAPTIDGVFLPKHPLELLRDGDFEPTEIMIGSNQDEGTYFILYDFMESFDKDGPSALNRHKFIDIINTIFKSMNRLELEAIIFQYTDWENVTDGYLNQKMVGDVVGDYFFICPTNLFAQMFADLGMSVYYYFFTQRTSTNLWAEWMGVIHGGEIEYVFGLPLNMSLQYNARERDLSLRITQSYARFALTGKPVSDDVDWPVYTRENQKYFIFNAWQNGLGSGPRLTACAFWNDFMPRLRNNSDADSCDDLPSLSANASNAAMSSGFPGPRMSSFLWWPLQCMLAVLVSSSARFSVSRGL